MRIRHLLIVLVTVVFIAVGMWYMPFLQAGSTDTGGDQSLPESAIPTVEPTVLTDESSTLQNETPLLLNENEKSENTPPLAERTNTDVGIDAEIDETVTSPATDDLADPIIIIETVIGFAQKQQTQLLGHPGWIHTVQKRTFHKLPSLYPEDTLLYENWDYVDATGLVNQTIGLVKTLDGLTRQIALFYEGQVINLAVSNSELEVARDWRPKTSEPIVLPLTRAANALQEIGLSERSVLTATLTDDLLYTVSIEYMEAEPITNDAGFPGQTVMGMKTEFVFDWQSDQLLSREVWFLVDDEWVPIEKVEFLQIEFQSTLPDNIAQLFNDLMRDVGE